MSETTNEVLKEAVARHRGAVLSLPQSEGLRHCKTRFLAEDGEGVWIEAVAAEVGLVDEAISKQAMVGVAFKAGTQKAVFATAVLRREEEYRLGPGLAVHAALLKTPENVQGVQRRSNYRVVVPAESDLSIRVWRVPDYWILRDKPTAKAELAIKVRDLSTGGMGLYCSTEGTEGQPIASDQRLRIAIKHGNIEALIDGRLRHVQMIPENNACRMGVQFMKLDNDIVGKQNQSKLSAIFGVLRRDEVRRLRVELMSNPTGQTPVA